MTQHKSEEKRLNPIDDTLCGICMANGERGCRGHGKSGLVSATNAREMAITDLSAISDRTIPKALQTSFEESPLWSDIGDLVFEWRNAESIMSIQADIGVGTMTISGLIGLSDICENAQHELLTVINDEFNQFQNELKVRGISIDMRVSPKENGLKIIISNTIRYDEFMQRLMDKHLLLTYSVAKTHDFKPSTKLADVSAQAKIPGVSLARLSAAGDIATETAGVINTYTKEAVTDSTVFQAASLSKPVFAYIVLKMVERGAFSRPGKTPESGLDRPLHEMCDFGPPDLRNHPNYKLLTPRNLLSHQAGLPNWFKPGETEAYVAPAETRFDYSGLAYCFLNEVVEHVAGKPLNELSREMFDDEPLIMNHSSFVPPQEGSAEHTYRAIGHYADGSADNRAPFKPIKANPAASLVTTAEDYAKFLNTCLHDVFIRRHMFEPQINLAGNDQKAMDAKMSEETLRQMSWGIGMGLQSADNGDTIAFHWGDNETSRAFTAINLRTNEAIACFTSSANGPSIFRQIAEPVVGKLSPICSWLAEREGLPMGKGLGLDPNIRPCSQEQKSTSVVDDPDLEDQQEVQKRF